MLQKVIRQQNYPFYALGWAIVITVVSSIPQLQIKSAVGIPELDKYVHVIIFSILAFLLSGALQGHIKALRSSKQVLMVFALIVVFGALDELHQASVAGRTSSWRDLVADALGGFIGAYLYQFFNNNEKKHLS